ncbi:MAG TPA: ATPase [Candidatus Ozemobacteraceae bacterium]
MSLKETLASITSVFGKVSTAPTHLTRRARPKRGFDVADLYEGPAETGTRTGEASEGSACPALDEKLRQAYFWITNHAIISPFYDIEFNDGPPQSFTLGDRKSRLVLPTDQSYSSFVLLPLLTLVLRRRCLLVGGPGRGKTASAILMGILAGYSMKDIRRAIQHGQPQMTIADLLGNPLPSSLVNAQTMDDVKISWRKWLGMRVKIIDEYNRIPTRTQSALLTVLADDYAELYDQIFECPPSAWYLTANDDAGGGTYQVIEALRDRIDVVVKALHFNTRFLGDLLVRIEEGIRPEDVVPRSVIFTDDELDRAQREILAVSIPPTLLRRIEFFTAHFEFCDVAADQIEYKTKDTAKLGGVDWETITGLDTGKDRVRDLGSQTRNGLSVRAMMTVLAYAKALAWFRGLGEVGFEDVRQIIPFVLHDKLVQDPDSPFFEQAGNATFRTDRIGWIRRLFNLSCQEYDRLGLDRDDPVAALLAEIGRGLDGVGEAEVRKRLGGIERLIGEIGKGRKLYGHLFDDVLALKYMHQRYTNYLKWLSWKDGV